MFPIQSDEFIYNIYSNLTKMISYNAQIKGNRTEIIPNYARRNNKSAMQ